MLEELRHHGKEFIFRRLVEPPEILGYALPFEPGWWLALAGPIVLLACGLAFYAYRREAGAIGRRWAAFLGTLRVLTIVTIFFVWLLPAVREVEWTEQRSRVVLLFDVSASMQQSDEPAPDDPGPVPTSRVEHVLQLLDPSASKFLAGLLERNPVVAYRFGQYLDERPWYVQDISESDLGFWREQLVLLPTADLALPLGGREITRRLQSIAERLRQTETVAEDLSARRQEEAARDLEQLFAYQQRVYQELPERTNLGQAVLQVLRKEAGQRIKGLIVFSDGRSNAGSPQDLLDAKQLAARSQVPIFTVGVGKSVETPNLRLADVLGPAQVQPEDEFPIRVLVEGDQLPAHATAHLTLTIERPDGTSEELRQETTLVATGPGRSSATVEFRISNPNKLTGAWKFRARVQPLKGERTRADNQSADPLVVRVSERKLSVLLFSGGPTREYQFLRTLLAREKDKFDLAIHLQTLGTSAVQDIDPRRLLEQFPKKLSDRDEDPDNLGNYDVLVALDPDWTQLDAGSREHLRRWVEDFGGGLILVAGPVHTFNLARDRDLQTIRDLYPVELDNRASSFLVLDRPTRDPFPLLWSPAATQYPFLDLTDSGDKSRFLEGWDQFFEVLHGAVPSEAPATRGFYSFFPILRAKPAATVLARFADSRYVTPSGERQPFFVLHTVKSGPVFYIGSGEMWRLREYSETFHERFWTKLIRHMGRGERARGSRRGLLLVGTRYLEGETAVIEAQLFDREMKPLRASAEVRVVMQIAAPQPELAPREWLAGIEMKPVPGRDGYFQAALPLRQAGRYRVEVGVPGSLEKLSGSFEVVRSDPERDLTRPDFALLHRLASEAREMELQDEKRRPEITAALQRARALVHEMARTAPPGSVLLTPENDSDRLFFTLDDASSIPYCIGQSREPFRADGRIIDLWDKGWDVWAKLDAPEQSSGPPWALVLLAGLVSAEWLTRKMLRLA
ncbi:MAG: hypothetical protein C4297_00885 [Gemmataceae bacterium]